MDKKEKDAELDATSNLLRYRKDEETDVDYNALGQAIDTTWGRSSTPRSSQYSVKLHVDGKNALIASYAAIVNFGTEREMIEMKRRYSEESQDVIKAIIKAAKDRYKQLTRKTISISEKTSSDSVEIIGVNAYNPKRSAYYRRKTLFELG